MVAEMLVRLREEKRLRKLKIRGMTKSTSRRPGPVFRSRLRPLSILDLERMTPAQLQRREAEEAQERQQWLDEQRRAASTRRP